VERYREVASPEAAPGDSDPAVGPLCGTGLANHAPQPLIAEATMTIPTTIRRTLSGLLLAGSLAASMAFMQAASAAPLITAVRPDHLESSRNEQVLSLLGKDFVPKMTISITDPAGGSHDVPASAIADVKPTAIHVTVTLPLDGDYSIVAANPAGTPSNAFGFHVGPRHPATGVR
jgi:hypothetical protein